MMVKEEIIMLLKEKRDESLRKLHPICSVWGHSVCNKGDCPYCIVTKLEKYQAPS